MSGMQISSHLEFAAAPADVYAMMTNQKFLDEVCVASESLSYNASVEGSVTKPLGPCRPRSRRQGSPGPRSRSTRKSLGGTARPMAHVSELSR